MTNNSLRTSLHILLTIAFIVFVVDFFAIEAYMLMTANDVPYWPLIFVFQIPMFALSLIFLFKYMNNPQNKTSISQVYIFLMTVRVFLCLAFLFPWLFDKDESSYPMVGQFFFIFFVLLVAEISLLVRELNQSVQKNEEEE